MRRFGSLIIVTALTFGFATGVLAASFTATGVLHGITNPWDDYVIELKAGTVIEINMICTDTVLDPMVQVLTEGGVVLAEDDDGGTDECEQGENAYLEFTAPASGRYIIRASSYEILEDNDPDDDNANGAYLLIVTAYLEEHSEPAGPPCPNVFDGRMNNSPANDCAAPVALYMDDAGNLDLYGIDPSNGEGQLVVRVSRAELEQLDDLGAGTVTVFEAAHPFTQSPLQLSRLATGELQLNAHYADGKPYVIVWNNSGALYHLAS